MQFSLLNLKMNDTCDSMTTPTSHNYCCYTILWKLKHQKCNITVGYYQRKLHQMLHQSEPGSLCAVNLLILGVIQQWLYETKIRDINDLRKRVVQTWFWLRPGDHRRCDWPVAWPSEIICACCWWTLWTHTLTWMFTYMIQQTISTARAMLALQALY